MRILLIITVICLFCWSNPRALAAAAESMDLLPYPQEVEQKVVTTNLTALALVSSNPTQSLAETTLLKLASDYGILLKPAAAVVVIFAAATPQRQEGGYTLKFIPTDAAVQIMISGDELGQFYAIQTLRQFIHRENGSIVLHGHNVVDWPTMTNRGVIEGFYGKPWTHTDRLAMLEFCGRYKLNRFIYAPKDDPYHREKWREQYPDGEMRRMSELIQTANNNGVSFVFAISPGLDIKFDSESDYQALVNKADALFRLGVREFAIFFDDIDANLGSEQAHLLNRFQNEFIAKRRGCRPLIMVPTEYNLEWAGNGKSEYTQVLAAELNQAIEVMWTGNSVLPAAITVADIDVINSAYRRKMFIWWNYPVNDGDNRLTLFMGPAVQLDSGLCDVVTGMVSNPMNEEPASEIPVATFADFVWNSKAYNKDRALAGALKQLCPGSAAAMKLFIDNDEAWIINNYQESAKIAADIAKFNESITSGVEIAPAAAVLSSDFNELESAVAKISQDQSNPRLTTDLAPYLLKMAKLVQAANACVDLTIAGQRTSHQEWWRERLKSAGYYNQAQRIPQKAARIVIEPFVETALNAADQDYQRRYGIVEITEQPQTGSVFSSFSGCWENNYPENILGIDTAKYFWSDREINVGDYIGIDLGAAQFVDNVYFEQGKNNQDEDAMRNGVLEISADGKSWTDVSVITGQHSLWQKNIDQVCRYVRIRSTGAQKEWFSLRRLRINAQRDVFYVSGQKTKPEELIVNILPDCRRFSVNPGVVSLPTGGNCGLQFRSLNICSGIEIAFAKTPANVQVEVSADAVNWIVLGRVVKPTFSTVVPLFATQIRLHNLGAEQQIEINKFTVDVY